ncbi:MAG: hypothetical protein M3416_02530 [Acidobacteriota bacterium]|nr:hypothetical protein [Acidobacteriota bacterium]
MTIDKRQMLEAERRRAEKHASSPRLSKRRAGDALRARSGSSVGVPAVEPTRMGLTLETGIDRPWSSDPEEFVEVHRRAFTSPYSLFIEGLDKTVVDERMFFDTVGVRLRREGIEVLNRKQDRDFASLRATMRTVPSGSNDERDQIVFFTIWDQHGTYITEFVYRIHPDSKIPETKQLGLELAETVVFKVREIRNDVQAEPKSKGGPRSTGYDS